MQSVIGEETDREIARLYREGTRAKIIGQILGVTVSNVFHRIERMRRMGEDLPRPFGPKLGEPFPGTERDPRAASLRHLADVKREHFQTRAEYRAACEYSIPAERACAPRNYAVYGSGVGSPAFSCADS